MHMFSHANAGPLPQLLQCRNNARQAATSLHAIQRNQVGGGRRAEEAKSGARDFHVSRCRTCTLIAAPACRWWHLHAVRLCSCITFVLGIKYTCLHSHVYGFRHQHEYRRAEFMDTKVREFKYEFTSRHNHAEYTAKLKELSQLFEKKVRLHIS